MSCDDARGAPGSVGEPARLPHYTYEEYRRFEALANAKHEYLDGQILAMAGGTPEHAALAAAVSTMLAQLRGDGPCRWFGSDLRVRVRATGLATYPDVTVICGELERDPDDGNNAVNPTLLVEVLSESTESYDRGEKVEHYRKIPSLREYLLVSHRARLIEHWWRDTSGHWQNEAAGGGEMVSLAALDITLGVDAVYDWSALTRDL